MGVASVCAPLPPNTTVPFPALNSVPFPLQDNEPVAFSLRILSPPFKVPAVSVTTPLKVWVKPVNPESRFSIPFNPLIVKAPPLRLPLNVAAPPDFDINTGPEVLNAPIFWSAFPVRVNPPDPVVVAPLLIKSPYKVNK